MKPRRIRAASVVALVISGCAYADEKMEMKKNHDPMTEDTARQPSPDSNPAGKPDTTGMKVAKAACAKLTGPARAECMDEMKNTYGIAPSGSKKAPK